MADAEFFFFDGEGEDEDEIVVSERLVDEELDELLLVLLVERELDVLELDRFRFGPLSKETIDDELKRMGKRKSMGCQEELAAMLLTLWPMNSVGQTISRHVSSSKI